jgi:biopolymer transport protein ExbD
MALKSLDTGDGEGQPGIIAEINITPLTDVFLVLLIIFMVTSSVMSQMGVDVNLPQASQATAQAQPKGVIISLLSGGRMRVNQQSISPEDYRSMKKALQTAFAQTSSRLVILEGDREAFLGSAIRVMDLAREAGAEKFAIATSVQQPQPGREK